MQSISSQNGIRVSENNMNAGIKWSNVSEFCGEKFFSQEFYAQLNHFFPKYSKSSRVAKICFQTCIFHKIYQKTSQKDVSK